MSDYPILHVTTPAKINLGLEILGRREDGYHEVRTVLATIGVYDRLHIGVVPDRASTRISGMTEVAQEDNLIQKAVNAFSTETGVGCGYHIEVAKRIPSPGGLGGASSDAASTLLALNEAHGRPVSPNRMRDLASALGSDVPFFLGSSVALATGTGTDVTPLPSMSGHIALVVPPVQMMTKTASLYGRLRAVDFSDGSTVKRVTQSIRSRRLPSASDLTNAFVRPLYEARPEIARLAGTMRSLGASCVAMSGAGPAHYALFEVREQAEDFARSMRRSALPEGTIVTVARIDAGTPFIEKVRR